MKPVTVSKRSRRNRKPPASICNGSPGGEVLFWVRKYASNIEGCLPPSRWNAAFGYVVSKATNAKYRIKQIAGICFSHLQIQLCLHLNQVVYRYSNSSGNLPSWGKRRSITMTYCPLYGSNTQILNVVLYAMDLVSASFSCCLLKMKRNRYLCWTILHEVLSLKV